MAYDESKVDWHHADLYHHGDDGRGLEDAEWDAQKADMIAAGTWPFADKE